MFADTMTQDLHVIEVHGTWGTRAFCCVALISDKQIYRWHKQTQVYVSVNVHHLRDTILSLSYTGETLGMNRVSVYEHYGL